MNYVTNYYKNLSEQLQEQVNVLQYKVKQLNEMRGPPGGAADDIGRFLEALFIKLRDGRLTIEKFIEKFQGYIAQHPSGEEGPHMLWRTWDYMRDHPEIMRFIRMHSNGDFLVQQVINGKTYHWFRTQSGRIYIIDEHGLITLVKKADDSPYGRIRDGLAKEPKQVKATERVANPRDIENPTPRSPKDGGRTPPGQSTPEPIE